VIRSWRVVLVNSSRVHSHPYFVCGFAVPVTTSMLNTVLKGGESIF
jgi:hypothetical protein